MPRLTDRAVYGLAIPIVLAALLPVAACGEDVEASGQIPCRSDEVDFWVVEVPPSVGPTNLNVGADTVSASTAFDIATSLFRIAPDQRVMSLADLDDVGFSQVDSGDDEVDCTFPPPSFRCPVMSVDIAANNRRQDFVISVRNLGSCAGTVGAYELSVFVGGSALVPEFLGSE